MIKTVLSIIILFLSGSPLILIKKNKINRQIYFLLKIEKLNKK
jgi:hypothetical protein